MAKTKTVKITEDDKVMAMLSHLLVFFAGFLAPLIMYLILQDKKQPYVLDHARHSLNFQISLLIYGVICFVLMLVLIGFVLAVLLGLFATIVIIIGCVKAYQGETYKYPLEIEFIK